MESDIKAMANELWLIGWHLLQLLANMCIFCPLLGTLAQPILWACRLPSPYPMRGRPKQWVTIPLFTEEAPSVRIPSLGEQAVNSWEGRKEKTVKEWSSFPGASASQNETFGSFLSAWAGERFKMHHVKWGYLNADLAVWPVSMPALELRSLWPSAPIILFGLAERSTCVVRFDSVWQCSHPILPQVGLGKNVLSWEVTGSAFLCFQGNFTGNGLALPYLGSLGVQIHTEFLSSHILHRKVNGNCKKRRDLTTQSQGA